MSDLRGYYDTSYPPSLWAPVVPPALTTITPATGVTGAGVTITATGTGFTPGSKIRFGATELTTTYVSATELTATGTLPAPNTYSVTVSDPNGISNGRPFIVTPPAPTLTGINPDTGSAGATGVTLTATGTGFVSGTEILLDGAAQATTVVNATTATAVVTMPAAGTHPVVVRNANGTSGSRALTTT